MHQQPHNDVIVEHQFTQQNTDNLILGIDEDIIINNAEVRNNTEQRQYSSFEASNSNFFFFLFILIKGRHHQF